MGKTIKVQTGRDSTKEIDYEERDDGWYVDSGEGFKPFAHENVREIDVRQLIKKEFDSRF